MGQKKRLSENIRKRKHFKDIRISLYYRNVYL